MDVAAISRAVKGILDRPGANYVDPKVAINADVTLLKMYDDILLGVASATDPLFDEYRKIGIIGPHFQRPRDWLPKAKSVISIFFLFSSRVARSNQAHETWPSNEWLHARIEGQKFIESVMEYLKDTLERKGYRTVVPSQHRHFDSVGRSRGNRKFSGLSYTSVWSERHVAYACGLGTFGLTKGLITQRGGAGRLGSLVTELALPTTERIYEGVYDYCSMCGVCAEKCPAGAISLREGKDHEKCSGFLDQTKRRYLPRYGCGKCQVGVPCQNKAPNAGG